MPITSLSLAVVGVDHANTDGSNRRTYIMLCEPGERVELVPDPKNPVDPQAVAVFSQRGGQLGYVTAERAPLVRSWILSGRPFDAIFQDTAPWGAIVRVALDGASAELPLPSESGTGGGERTEEPGAGWWPDDLPPDD